MSDQYTFADPSKLYQGIETKEEYQDGPGLDADLENRADLGEQSYRAPGRLEGRRALGTGGDCGSGGPAAVAVARRVALVELPYRPAQPAELAPAFVFLASQESSFVNGETLGVTGGQPLP